MRQIRIIPRAAEISPKLLNPKPLALFSAEPPPPPGGWSTTSFGSLYRTSFTEQSGELRARLYRTSFGKQ